MTGKRLPIVDDEIAFGLALRRVVEKLAFGVDVTKGLLSISRLAKPVSLAALTESLQV